VTFQQTLILLLPLAAIVGVLLLTAHWISVRRSIRELEIKERIALIEKGIAPAPERTASGSVEGESLPPVRADRYRSSGILLVGLGLALMLLLATTAGIPAIGVGVGGSIAIVGAALIANSLFGKGGPRGG
jgi:hypothetical protein